jgi:hypothetical protein
MGLDWFPQIEKKKKKGNQRGSSWESLLIFQSCMREKKQLPQNKDIKEKVLA